MPDRPRIVVLGGGFGGVGAIKKLGDADADVLLVDKHDYHTFQPLLYQVATDLLEPPTVGHPLRDLFHDQANVKVKQVTVTGSVADTIVPGMAAATTIKQDLVNELPLNRGIDATTVDIELLGGSDYGLWAHRRDGSRADSVGWSRWLEPRRP